MNNSYDRWLTSVPEEPEAIICESCGQEMEILEVFQGQKYAKCVNPFCPNKHTGIAKEIAEKLVDALDTVSRLESMVKHLKNQLGQW